MARFNSAGEGSDGGVRNVSFGLCQSSNYLINSIFQSKRYTRVGASLPEDGSRFSFRNAMFH
jgi:hypothetical protein